MGFIVGLLVSEGSGRLTRRIFRKCQQSGVTFPTCEAGERLGYFKNTCDEVVSGNFGSGQGVCPGPTMLDRCLACFSRNQGQLMIGETVDIDLTFTCRTIRWGWGFFSNRRIDIQCMESDNGMTTTPRP